MRYILSIIILALTISCNSTKNGNSTIYFGGEVVNPKSNYVLLLKDDIVIDSLNLDKNNRFINKYNSLEEGLYTFKHGIEFQYIYLEPKDSILIRLNTWDFDESLVFSGNGSSKNEFLINLFLQNEKEEKAMYRYFNLNEQKFESKLDSLTNERISIYNNFAQNLPNELSDGFKKLTNSAIHFPIYRLKEVYPYYNKKANNLAKFPTVSSNFYKFRKDIDLDESDLVSFYPYQNYVVSYMYNLSHQLKEKDSTQNNITINLLNAIIDNVEIEDFKNTLLKKVVVNDFLKSESTCSINEKTLELFLDNCTNRQAVNQVKNLVNDSKKVRNNAPLENFKVASITKDSININDIIKKKNTVIYFWSTEFMSSEYLTNRIQFLEKKYPSILFIGISMQNSLEEISNDPNFKKLDTSKQFILTKNSIANTFLTSKYPRTIIIDNKGIVKNGFTYLDSRKLGSELNKL
ncbi:hypothetical protein SAMN05444411_102199 [Lutibacter oricola]|uniref:Thioredoxin domain-containing protein n=1 Tax=Lutibacter oricola TaxID=762486 RepID=A0A1H2WHB9_9FLAO|nr:hypothetical protein [Lutibacter oricola]SDW79908.1 hypothetical protein SAMN05444411_102199 [Lutibacter oricola]